MSTKKGTNYADKRHIERRDYCPEAMLATHNKVSDMFSVLPKRQVQTGTDWSFEPEKHPASPCVTYTPEVIALVNKGYSLDEAKAICEHQDIKIAG